MYSPSGFWTQKSLQIFNFLEDFYQLCDLVIPAQRSCFSPRSSSFGLARFTNLSCCLCAVVVETLPGHLLLFSSSILPSFTWLVLHFDPVLPLGAHSCIITLTRHHLLVYAGLEIGSLSYNQESIYSHTIALKK